MKTSATKSARNRYLLLALFTTVIVLGVFIFTIFTTGGDPTKIAAEETEDSTTEMATPETLRPAFEHLIEFPNIRDFTMSSTTNEAYFTVQSPLEELSVLAKIKKQGNGWSPPELVAFSGKYRDLEPFLSNDGLRLYFVSNRPLSDSTEVSKDFDIWYVEREGISSAWGKPINIGAPINTKYNEFYPSVALNNNLYFTSDNPMAKGKDDIFYSAWRNGTYAAPIALGDAINTIGYEFNAYISPDEKFMIYSGYNREDGYGSGDLYISFRDEDQKWGTSINLGEDFNSKYMDYCPFIDMDSMTLYFTSRRSSIEGIHNFQAMEDVVEAIHRYENGFSRIYKRAIDESIITNRKSMR